MFYSPATLGCISCSALISNCATCQRNGGSLTLTSCVTCANNYYLSGNTCLLCDIRCSTCSGPTTCSACSTNLVVVGSFCACDTVTDPTLSYYATNNMCLSCTTLLSNCLTCNPDPLACTAC